MDIVWNAKRLKEALNIDLPSDFVGGKVDFNSKDIAEGDIFIALPGEKRDGHEFVQDALSKGAALAICSQKIDSPKVAIVSDTTEALLKLAKYSRANSNAKYIGVTGSVGKTSTKEAIASILSNFESTYFNKGSFNNHIGVPLTLASCPIDAKFSVNEMGMNHAGEIRELTKLVKPHIAVITQLGEAHIEFLGSRENICKAKCEIFEGLVDGGVAIINKDSEFFDLQMKILAERNIREVYSFSESQESDCFIVDYQKAEDHAIVSYNILGKIYKTKNHLIGKHQAVNIGGALLVALALGLDMDKATNSVQNIKQFYGRGEESKVIINGKTLSIINDGYNANPTSLGAALENLATIKGKKIAILSNMVELGEDSAILHASMKDKVLKAGVSELYTVGDLIKNLHNELKDKINCHHYDSISDETFDDIYNKIKNEDATILVKGSNSTLIRTIVDFIKGKVG